MVRRHSFTQVQLIFDLIDDFASKRWGEREKPVLPLPRPAGQVRFLVITKPGIQEFKDAMQLIVKQNPEGYYLFFGDVRLPDGSRRQRYLKGNPNIYIVSPYYQTEILPVVLPAPAPEDPELPKPIIKPTTVHLKPGPAYPFPRIPFQTGPTMLRGQVVQEIPRKPSDIVGGGNNGRPLQQGIASVEVKAEFNNQELSYSLTDRSGQWLFILPHDLKFEDTTTIQFTLKKGGDEVEDKRKLNIRVGENNNITPPLLWSQ